MPGGKTITRRKIEVRSPDGRLLSTTFQKTISYGPKAVLPDCPENTNNLVNTTILTPEARRRSVSERTELVDLDRTRECGDSTIYGDHWSEFDQTTLMRRARVVGPPTSFHLPPVNSLSAFVYEINAQRRSHGVRELRPDDRLMHTAKERATQMALDKQIRLTADMNVWMGTKLNVPRVVDEWAAEMKDWRRNYFAVSGLETIGVGQAIIDAKHPLSLVVVLYN